jgi:pyruvate dehydrogenase E2 component (dihydrolipoamide acetyltransferase)
METGSISRWNVKEGDRFEPGTAFCDVETDKATVSFDATDEGFVAKILVGSGEVKVGQPIMITVEEEADLKAFANFTLAEVQRPAAVVSQKSPAAAVPEVAAASAPSVSSTPSKTVSSSGNSRIFASPLARKLTRDANQTMTNVSAVLNGQGTGPNNRFIAADVVKGLSLISQQPAGAQKKEALQAQPSSSSKSVVSSQQSSSTGPYADFELSDIARDLSARLTVTKQTVPHYYVSVELNLKNLLEIRETFNKQFSNAKKSNKAGESATSGLSVMDFLVKGAALAMKQVPDVNGSWMDTFVRRYDQVDINLVLGSGTSIATPILRDVGSRGLTCLSEEISSFENALFSKDQTAVEHFINDPKKMAIGTFSIHNLGGYGIKSAAPIVLSPQSCALAFGAIVDTVVPSAESDKGWEVAPVMIATISCDHRVVDGAVSAQYLAAFKQLIENPMNLML